MHAPNAALRRYIFLHATSLIHFSGCHFTDTSDAHSREQSDVKNMVVAVSIAIGFLPDLKKGATHSSCKMHLL